MRNLKIISAVTAVSLLLSGCQSINTYDESFITDENKQNPDAGSVVPVGEDTLTTKVRSEDFPFPENVTWVSNLTPTDDGFICLGSGENSTETCIYRYHTETAAWSETILVPLSPHDGYYYIGSLVSFGEDAYCTLSMMENHSNMEPYKPGVENFDWDAWNESCESEYYLCTYTADGTLAGKMQVTGLENYKGDDGYDRFSGFYYDGENTFVTLRDGMILRIKADGTLEETSPAVTEDMNDWILTEILSDRDGKPVCYTYRSGEFSYDEVTEMYTLADFDPQTGKSGEPFYSYESGYIISRTILSGGNGDYRLFANEAEGSFENHAAKLYGIRDDGSKEVVIDWDASDMEAISVIPLADGSFIGEGSDGKLCRLTRRYASEISGKQDISIGVLGNATNIRDFVRKYNRSQDDYKLNIVTYQNSDGTYWGSPDGKNDALDNLKLAVVSGDAPDLVFMQVDGSYWSSSDYHDTFLRLGARGVFCDLYELMESDTEVNRETLLPNVLTAMEHPNGSLYSMTRGFFVSSIAVKSKFTTKENWTMDDMIALYDDADDIMYYWSTKQDTLRMLMMGTDFTDELSGTCSFDSPEFIKMLEFCNRYPAETTEPEKSYEDQAQYDKWMKWLSDNYHRYQEDTDYLFYTTFSALDSGSIASAWAYTKADLGGDFTLVGYPSNNGKGGKITADGEIAILNTCENKAGAWEVVKAYAHNTDNFNGSIGYSVFDKTFEEQLDREMYIWDFGGKSDAEFYDDDSRVFRLTQEERDGLEEYIRGIDTYQMLDEKVAAIVYEEAGMYFSGDRSVEETAKMIQSRASIYLSEQS